VVPRKETKKSIIVVMCLQYLLSPLFMCPLFGRVIVPQFVFCTFFILFALEYKKTPTRAIAVPIVTHHSKRDIRNLLSSRNH